MASSGFRSERFRPDRVGMCPATLLAEPMDFHASRVEESLRAAAEAGFPSLSLWSGWATGVGVEATRKLLAELGLSVPVVEGAAEWAGGAEAGREEGKALLDLCAALGADTVLAFAILPDLEPARAAEGLAALCEGLQAGGVRAAVEFFPGSSLPDLATAWGLVRESGAANAGLTVDVLHWHHQPGGPDLAALRAVPAERIHYVQLCDAPPGPAPPPEEYMAFALSGRAVPGEGVADIPALLGALDEMGAAPYLALEVFQTALAREGAAVMARKLRDASNRLLSSP